MVITTIPLDVTPRLKTASTQLTELAAELGQLPCGMMPSDPGERARLGQHADELIARLVRVADDLRVVVTTLAAVEELDGPCSGCSTALRLVLQGDPPVVSGADQAAEAAHHARAQVGRRGAERLP